MTNSTNAKDYTVLTTDRGNKYLIPLKYANLPNVSAIIRAMSADGYTNGALAKTTGLRPQHVSNVLKSSDRGNVDTLIAEIEASNKS